MQFISNMISCRVARGLVPHLINPLLITRQFFNSIVVPMTAPRTLLSIFFLNIFVLFSSDDVVKLVSFSCSFFIVFHFIFINVYCFVTFAVGLFIAFSTVA